MEVRLRISWKGRDSESTKILRDSYKRSGALNVLPTPQTIKE